MAISPIQRLRGFEIAAEGFLDDDAAPVTVILRGKALLAELTDDFRNELRQRRKVIESIALGMVAPVEFGDLVFQFDEIGGRFEIAREVVGAVSEPVAQVAIVGGSAGVLAEIFPGPLAKIFFRELVFGETENRKLLRQKFVAGEVVKGGQQLPRRKVAGSAEDHHEAAIGYAALIMCCLRRGHAGFFAGSFAASAAACCSMCPPNC